MKDCWHSNFCTPYILCISCILCTVWTVCTISIDKIVIIIILVRIVILVFIVRFDIFVFIILTTFIDIIVLAVLLDFIVLFVIHVLSWIYVYIEVEFFYSPSAFWLKKFNKEISLILKNLCLRTERLVILFAKGQIILKYYRRTIESVILDFYR